jgi:hypothetical protein
VQEQASERASRRAPRDDPGGALIPSSRIQVSGAFTRKYYSARHESPESVRKFYDLGCSSALLPATLHESSTILCKYVGEAIPRKVRLTRWVPPRKREPDVSAEICRDLGGAEALPFRLLLH